MWWKFLWQTLFIALLASCHGGQSRRFATPRTVIVLQPFAGMPKKQQQWVYAQLKAIYPLIKLNPAIPFPAAAYSIARGRYRADSLLRYLEAHNPQHTVTIGLTDRDISTTKGRNADWGVMGLGYCPGRTCIASSFRLSKESRCEQLFKVVVHEFGHTQGLAHCPEKACLMRDAKGQNPIDEEQQFCGLCNRQLNASGWNLKRGMMVNDPVSDATNEKKVRRDSSR